MKKTLKKLSALVLALAMIVAMSATAFAADMDGEDGVIGEFTTPDTAAPQTTSVTIYKEITAYNPDGSTVNAPAITFNYTIAAGEAGKNIYDAKSHHDPEANAHALTKAGVGTPTITGTAAGVLQLVPGTDTFDTSVNGTANRYKLTVSFDGIFKTGSTPNYTAGVYRYVISETTAEATKNASGIKEGEGANTLYMDVYVDGSGDIYGYVLFTNNDDIDAREDNDAAAATDAGKVEGFVGTADDGANYASEDPSTADKYYTFDLKIGKTVVNDNYTVSTKHQFPFTVTLANTTVTADVLPIMTINDSTLATQTALTAGAIAGTWNPTIASGGTITYVGIPTGTTVTIKEQNDVTGVTYTSKSDGADTDADSKEIYTGDVSNNAVVDCNATALTIANENHTTDGVIFTNTLLLISPTGVVLRFGPYALMLGAGLALLILTIRRKSLKDED